MNDGLAPLPYEEVVEIASTTSFIEKARRNPYVPGVDMTVLPPDELVSSGFPVERVRLYGFMPEPMTKVIHGTRREWLHVYRTDGFIRLCLWTERDPTELVWRVGDGWLQYFRIVQRHLAYEEYARRNGGRWPIEDAHGPPGNSDLSRLQMPSGRIRSAATSWQP